MPKSVQLAFMALVGIGLFTTCGLLSRHAIYVSSYRDDGLYYVLLALSFLSALGGGLVFATACGFFPDVSLPHLDLF